MGLFTPRSLRVLTPEYGLNPALSEGLTVYSTLGSLLRFSSGSGSRYTPSQVCPTYRDICPSSHLEQ